MKRKHNQSIPPRVIDFGLTLFNITEENLLHYYYYYGIEKIGVYVIESKYATELGNGDRIVSLNGTEIETTADMKELFKDCKAGDVITIVAERGGESFTCSLTVRKYVPDGNES